MINRNFTTLNYANDKNIIGFIIDPIAHAITKSFES